MPLFPHCHFERKREIFFVCGQAKDVRIAASGKHRAPRESEGRCFMQTALRKKTETGNEKDPSAALGMTKRGNASFHSFSTCCGSQPRLAALGSPFQGKGLAWTLPPSYGRRCPEGAEVGWGKRDERSEGRFVSVAPFAAVPEYRTTASFLALSKVRERGICPALRLAFDFSKNPYKNPCNGSPAMLQYYQRWDGPAFLSANFLLAQTA